MKDCRCSECNRKLAELKFGEVHILCKCKRLNIFTADNPTGNDRQSSEIKHEETLSCNSVPDQLK